ncbi:dihydrolipoyl dehydrogenase [Clostridium vitabionis]|uniref:dihydrolipoyl dehydrogenase n=1 Tax=Clostridium vitabionis TaxID=2784388 RepID=UPI00188B266E|nr:dihydrolipoyl dehydrogenase [Clostridium vitabionis]
MSERYDLVIIGGGPGGYTAAEHAAKLGMSTAVIEMGEIGGSCVNLGCIPAKALLQAATVYRDIKRASHFGLSADHVSFSMEAMQKFREETVAKVRSGISRRLDAARVEVICGEAKLHRENSVEIRTAAGIRYVSGERVIIATGSDPIIPDIPGVMLPQVMRSHEILKSTQWNFNRLSIVGGGVVGVELATLFASLGSEVTLFERSTRLLCTMDETISEYIKRSLEDKGVRVLLGVTVTEITEQIPALDSGPVLVHFRKGNVTRSIPADRVLTAVGRKPDLAKVLAEDAEVKLDSFGKPKVTPSFLTTQPGCYAIGDTVSRMRLAHVATSHATFVVEHMAKKSHRMLLSVVPNGMYVVLPVVPICIYTDPEIASVGFTEAEAATYNMKVKIGMTLMDENSKAIMLGKTIGFVKVIFEAYTNTLVGAQIVCSRATDMIGEMATAIANGLTAYQLTTAMRAHPTYSEAIAEAVEDALRDDQKEGQE